VAGAVAPAIVAAVVAVQAQEAVGEDSAAEIGPKLVLDEAGDASALATDPARPFSRNGTRIGLAISGDCSPAEANGSPTGLACISHQVA
jgi:hypothetical protein